MSKDLILLPYQSVAKLPLKLMGAKLVCKPLSLESLSWSSHFHGLYIFPPNTLWLIRVSKGLGKDLISDSESEHSPGDMWHVGWLAFTNSYFSYANNCGKCVVSVGKC